MIILVGEGALTVSTGETNRTMRQAWTLLLVLIPTSSVSLPTKVLFKITHLATYIW